MGTAYVLDKGVFFESFAEEVLVFSLGDYRPRVLGGVAAEVFLLTDGRNSVGDIARRLAGEYGQDPALVQRDVEDFYGELAAQGLVREAV